MIFAAPAPARGLVTINVPADYTTIQAAIDAASDGDRIRVAPGTYSELLDFLGKDLDLASTDGPAVTTILNPGGNPFAITMSAGEPPTAIVRGFTISSVTPVASDYALLVENGSGGQFIDNVVVDIGGIRARDGALIATGNDITNAPRGALSSEDSDVLFQDNVIGGPLASNTAINVSTGSRPDVSVEIIGNKVHGTDAQALHLVGVDAPVVRGNILTGNDEGVVIIGTSPLVENNVFALNGLTANTTQSKNEIDFRASDAGVFANNTVYGLDDNARKFMFTGPATTVVSNNIFAGAVRWGLVDCSNNITMRWNTFWNTTSGALAGNCTAIGVDNNKKERPHFVNKDGFDFHLLASSPAIDDARAADAPNTDADGNVRPLDGNADGTEAADRGAFEFTGAYVRGSVTSSGNARAHVCVTAFTRGLSRVTETRTLANGTYRLNVSPGQYKLEFSDCRDGILATEWYDDHPSGTGAQSIRVTALQDVTGIDADLGTDMLCDGRQVTIVGTPGNDRIRGTAGPDVIAGLGGDDVITSAGGADVVCAGDGRDTINGGSGTDRLFGEELGDVFKGSSGRDLIDGGPDDEINTLNLRAAPRAVDVNLYKGKIYGWGGRNIRNVQRVSGSRFDDILIGDRGNNELLGGPGNDLLNPMRGDDLISGEAGHDTFLTAKGYNLMEGGDGDDLFILRGLGTNDLEGDRGTDAVVFSDPAGSMEMEQDSIRIGEARHSLNDVEIVEGTPFADRFILGGYHSDGIVRVFAGGGNDVLEASYIDQYLDGGSGNDTLISRGRYQVLVGGSGDDLLQSLAEGALMAPGSGIDTVVGSDDPDDAVTFELEPGPVVIDLTFGVATWDGGTAALSSIDHAVGTAFDDTIKGNDQQNALVGLAGDDVLRGRGEDDFLDGSEGSDTLAGGGGEDFCQDGESHSSCEHTASTDALSPLVAHDSLIHTIRHPGIAELIKRHIVGPAGLLHRIRHWTAE